MLFLHFDSPLYLRKRRSVYPDADQQRIIRYPGLDDVRSEVHKSSRILRIVVAHQDEQHQAPSASTAGAFMVIGAVAQ